MAARLRETRPPRPEEARVQESRNLGTILWQIPVDIKNVSFYVYKLGRKSNITVEFAHINVIVLHFCPFLLMGYPHGSANPHQRYRRRILSSCGFMCVRSSTFFPVPLYSHTLSLSLTKCEKIQEEREEKARVLAQLEAKLNPFFQCVCCPCLLLLTQGM